MVRRILRSMIPVALVIVLSTIGYRLFWGWSLSDAFFMTVITVGTVGYGEVRPLDQTGEIFTSLVILAGVVAGGFALSTIFSVLVEGQIKGVWEGRRMSKRIDSMSGHTIVAGVGRVGNVVARSLEADGCDFVVIDTAESSIDTAREKGWAFIQGDATEEEVLERAGIARAGSIVTTLNADADNMFVSVTARSLSPTVMIIARSSHESSESKLLKGGADRVVTPNVIGGRRMAMMIQHPSVSDYFDVGDGMSGSDYQVQELTVDEASGLIGVRLDSAGLPSDPKARILVHISADGAVTTAPVKDVVLSLNDRLIILEHEGRSRVI